MNAAGISAQLEKILSSQQFSQAERLSRFLRFVVDAAQAGQAESVKEYLIGVEVFDRGKDFDPRIDPIVRVQAAKLRSKLLEYYSSAGAEDSIVISMPKGSYAPDIREQKPAASGMAARTLPARSHIAVLPFVNMSSDPENEYFSDGLTEELINRLASVPSLQVVARTSAFRFKGRNEDLREVGAQLNVGTVMEGSVRKAGDQLRVTAQLIDVQSGYHLFSQTYQRRYRDIFELQDELAQAVVNEVAPLSGGRSPGVIVRTRAVNLDAYNAYLRGMYAMTNRFPEREEWIDCFQEATRIDPGYAPAWAGLAYGYFMLAWFYQMPSPEAMPLSKKAALRTLELDPGHGEGHSSLGMVQAAYQWDWVSAETSFQRAMQLQPGVPIIYTPYACYCLLPQRRIEEACTITERALELDPFNPLSRALAIFLYAYTERYEEAFRHHAFGMEFNPKFPPFFYSAGIAFIWQGLYDKAIPEIRRAVELGGEIPGALGLLGYALAVNGEKKEAREILQKLTEMRDQPAVDIATVHLGLQDEEETLRWLERAVEERNVRLVTVPADRRFRLIADSRRFQTILSRMGLGQAAASK